MCRDYEQETEILEHNLTKVDNEIEILFPRLESQVVLRDYELEAIRNACEDIPITITKLFPSADKELLKLAITELTESVMRRTVFEENGDEALENIEPAISSPHSRHLNIMLASRGIDVGSISSRMKLGMNSILGRVGDDLSKQPDINVLEEFDETDYLISPERQFAELEEFMWMRIPNEKDQRELADLWISLGTRGRQILVDDMSGHRLAQLMIQTIDTQSDPYALATDFMETLRDAEIAEDYRVPPNVLRRENHSE